MQNIVTFLLGLDTAFENIRLVYGSPRNIYCAHKIGIAAVSADLAGKKLLGLSICSLAVPTLRTGTRCIAWINKQYANTGKPCFIFYVGAKLIERPIMQSCLLAFLSPNPFADVL